MLTAITDPKEIQNTQALLESRLQETLKEKNQSYTIGHQGGNITPEKLFADHKIWFVSNKLENSRYWNAFGLASNLKTKNSNDIVVEINIPLEGINRRIVGLFAEDTDGNTVLLHRGKIGGGGKGIGKTQFLKWSYQKTVQVKYSNDNSVDEMLLVANLNLPNVAEQIGKFVMAVAEFKLKVQEDKVAGLTDVALTKKVNSSRSKPKQTTVETLTFIRNKYVAEYVKRRAQGICDLCEKEAPFSNTDRKPYLECHHIEWLANGGNDTIENAVALCPNCHRRMHILKEHKDINQLKEKAKRVLT